MAPATHEQVLRFRQRLEREGGFPPSPVTQRDQPRQIPAGIDDRTRASQTYTELMPESGGQIEQRGLAVPLPVRAVERAIERLLAPREIDARRLPVAPFPGSQRVTLQIRR